MSRKAPAASPHADRAYVVLRDLIIRGRLAAGARAPEVELAARLGISRTPVREALRRLAHEGFLVAPAGSRRQRFAVAPLTAGDLRDVYASMAAQALARRRTIDVDRIFDAHNAVHHAFVDACATPRLRSLIEQVRPQVDRYEFVYAPQVGPSYDETFAEHKAMIRALRDGAAGAAEAAIRANWLNGAARLEKAIQRTGPRGDYSGLVISVH